MRFGANLLRGARPIHLDGGAPAPGGGAPSLGALWARHQKPLLIGGAGVAVALGLMHHRNQAGAVDPATGLPTDQATANGATVAGYQPADTSGTDVYNALQPQIEQTQSMLQQLLSALSLAPKTTAAAKPKAKHHPKPKAKHHPKPKRKRRRRHHPAAPARRVAAPAPHKAARHTVHVARRGETAASIGARYGTNFAAVLAANSRLTATPVSSGQRLVVPNPQVRT
jgi:hypothetical protein